MRAGRWLLIVILWVVGCGPEIRLPSHGGPAWVEVQSEHFTLWTDGSAQRGREIVGEMERRRQVILTALSPASRTRVFVIALRDRLEVGDYRPVNVEASAWDADNPTGHPGILMAADDVDHKHVANHEMAHVFSFEVVAHQPAWLAEGIAQYFDTFDVSSGRADVTIGIPRGDHLRFLASRYPLPAADLFSCKVGCGDDQFYATSWAVFSLLVDHHHAQLTRFLQRLDELWDSSDDAPWYRPMAALPKAERERKIEQRRERRRSWAARAWREAFPDLPPDKLDRELLDWLVAGKLRLPHIPVTVGDVRVTERKLDEADVLAARSWLGFMFTDDMAAARRDASEALALDRTHVLARLIMTALVHTITPDDARATAAAHPDDWRALRLVVLALSGTREGDEALGRLCAMSTNAVPECAHADGHRDASAIGTGSTILPK
jgi:hypothetical protein